MDMALMAAAADSQWAAVLVMEELELASALAGLR